MIRFYTSRRRVALILVAVLILAAGGVAVASNMGFKMNKALYPPNGFCAGSTTPCRAAAECPVGITCNITNGTGDNWTSLPLNSPYPNYNAVCVQLNLPAVGTVLQINPYTGGNQGPCTCGPTGSGCSTTLLTNLGNVIPGGLNGLGIRLRGAGVNGFAIAGTSAIIVGSHNPSAAVNLPILPSTTCNPHAAPGPPFAFNASGFWYSVPYHTTAVTFGDICRQAGLTPGPVATIFRSNAQGGGTVPVTCGTTTADATPLVLGEAIRIRRTTNTGPSGGVCGDSTFIPAHF